MSRDVRFGRKVRIVGMDVAGAPLRRRSWRRGRWASTVIRIVGGTPAHLWSVGRNQHVRSEHEYEKALTPSSRWVRVLPRGSDQPWRTRGGPSMHQREILRRPVREVSLLQTGSLRSLCVRMVSSRKGSWRRTARKERRMVWSVVELSSAQVMDVRFVQRERAVRVSWVMFG